MPVPSAMAKRMVEITSMASDPDVDDLPDRQPSEELEKKSETENRPARGMVPHLVKVVGRDHDHEHAHAHRQRAQNDSGQAPRRGEGLDVPQDPEPVADELAR